MLSLLRMAALIAAAALGLAVAISVVPHRVNAETAATATALTSTTPSTTATSTTSPVGAQSASAASDFRDSFWRILVLTLVLLGAWSIPTLIDIRKGYKFEERRLGVVTNLIDKATEGGQQLTADEVKSLLAAGALGRTPKGFTGLARVLMAFVIATSVALALVILFATGSDANTDLVKTIVTTLTGALTTIIGFYFGARTAQAAQSPTGDG